VAEVEEEVSAVGKKKLDENVIGVIRGARGLRPEYAGPVKLKTVGQLREIVNLNTPLARKARKELRKRLVAAGI
jgi:hypothetical protein